MMPSSSLLLFSRAHSAKRGIGFTLVELLVTVSIIAILAGILFPVISRSIEACRGSRCTSNLSQLGKAIDLYCQDHNDRYPYGLDSFDRIYPEAWRFSEASSPPYWNPVTQRSFYREVKALIAADQRRTDVDVVLFQYAPDRELWHCPSDTGVVARGVLWNLPYDTKGKTMFEAFQMSYHYRTELALSQIACSWVKRPAATNVLMDGTGYWHSRYRRPPRHDGSDTADERLWGYNVLFADGHVKNLTASDFYRNAWGTRIGYGDG